jgi:hypothetical protein
MGSQSLNNGLCGPDGLSACPHVGRTELICRIFRVLRQEGPDGFLLFLRFQAEAFCVAGAFRMSNCGLNGTPRVETAQMMRASLLATATAARLRPRLFST